jgi:hypothetical protein
MTIIGATPFHDGYPSYEVYHNADKVYDHHQGDVNQLFGSGDVKIP